MLHAILLSEILYLQRRFLTASQFDALKLHGSLNFNRASSVGECADIYDEYSTVRFNRYFIVAYLQAATRIERLMALSTFGQHCQPTWSSHALTASTARPPKRRTCRNFLNAFLLTSWCEKFAVKYFAQILFSHAFVFPIFPTHFPPYAEFQVLQRKLYQCALSFQEFSVVPCCVLPLVLLFSTCILPCIGIFSAYLYRFRSLCCYFCYWWSCCCGCQCNVQRATLLFFRFVLLRILFLFIFFCCNFPKTQTWKVVWNICGARFFFLFHYYFESFQINCAIKFVTMSKAAAKSYANFISKSI